MNHMDYLSAALNFVGGTMIAYVILWLLAELVKKNSKAGITMTNAEELRRAIEDAAKALKESYNYDDETLETLLDDQRKRKARLKMLEEAEQRERKADDDTQ